MTESTIATPLAARVALFGKVGGLVAALGVSAHVVTALVLGDPHELVSRPFLVHVASSLVPWTMWAICRTPRTNAVARTVETVGLCALAASIAFMSQALAHETTPLARDAAPGSDAFRFGGLLADEIYEGYAKLSVFAMTLMFMVRSALVPSRVRVTVALGAGIGAAMLGVLVAGHAPPPGATPSPTSFLVSTAVSWVVATGGCAVLSWVIHGLHREIEKARKLGQYTLEEKIGEGGMGAVYRARHAMLRRPTAIKLLERERVGDEAIARFEREVQITAELTHPNTVTVFDYGRTPEGVFYYAMELLGGDTLQSIVEATGVQPPARVVHIVRMIAGALGEAHGRGLIHRDVKPANIVLGERGGLLDVATVLDFGLVVEIERGDAPTVTMDGKIVGTPMYLAPEAIRGTGVDARSDLYALGAVAYFMLTGQTVFDGKSVVEICSHHLHSIPTPPSERLGSPTPSSLEALVLRCLAKDPADRPASAQEVLEALATEDLPRWTQDDARAWRELHPSR